jgi:hypothetical protein
MVDLPPAREIKISLKNHHVFLKQKEKKEISIVKSAVIKGVEEMEIRFITNIISLKSAAGNGR